MTCFATRAAILAAIVLSACGDDPDYALREVRVASPCGEDQCERDCHALAGDNCDIRDKACQKRVFRAAECVWGFDGELPTVEVIGEDELLDVYFGDRPEERDPLDGVWDRALQMLHLQAPSVDGLEAARASVEETVAAFYFAEDDEVYVVDRGMALDDDWSLVVLAHEFLHALQYQSDTMLLADRAALAYDLDRGFAVRMAVEGDATIHEELAWSLLSGIDVYAEGQTDSLRYRLAYAQRRVFEAESPFAVLNSLAYPVGGMRLWERWLDDKGATVAHRSKLPKRVVGWMRPASDEASRDPLSCDVSDAPEGYLDFSVSEVGADIVYAFWAQLRVGADEVLDLQPTWVDASHVTRSRLRIFATDALDVAVAWRTGFDSRERAELFEREASELGDLEVTRDANEVLIRASENAVSWWSAEFCPVWRSLSKRVRQLDDFDELLGSRKGRRRVPPRPPVYGPDQACAGRPHL